MAKRFRRRRIESKVKAAALTVAACVAAAPISAMAWLSDLGPWSSALLFGTPIIAATAASLLAWQWALSQH